MQKPHTTKPKERCAACTRSLPPQVVCRVCFTEMGITPFVQFKLLHTTNIQRCQKAIAVADLAPLELNVVRTTNQHAKRLKVLQLKRRLLTQLTKRVGMQQQQIASHRQIIGRLNVNRTNLENTVADISNEVKRKKTSLEPLTNQIQRLSDRIRTIRAMKLKNVCAVTDPSVSQEYPAEITIQKATLPVLDDECQTSLSFESMQLVVKNQDQTWSYRVLYWLESIFRRVMLVARLFAIELPYIMTVRSPQELLLSHHRLLLHVDGSLMRLPRNIKPLVGYTRKRKSSIYIDEDALMLLQTNCDYLASRAGVNFSCDRDRVLASKEVLFLPLIAGGTGFPTTYKLWESCLSSSMALSVGNDKLVKAREAQEREEADIEFSVLEERRECHSIHSSSEDLNDSFNDADEIRVLPDLEHA